MPALLFLTADRWSRDPRARRAAAAAAAAGLAAYAIDVGGESSAAADLVTIRHVPRRALSALRRCTAQGDAPRLGSPALRELRGAIRLARRLLSSIRMTLAAGAAAPTIVHAHDLDTLPAAYLIARRHRARLVYDAHELYTGFDRDPPRLWLALTKRLEGALARRADAVVTVSDEIADRLVELYSLERRPIVVLNAPPLKQIEVAPHDGPLRVVYQAAVGPGRHLDDLPDVDGVDVSARVLGASAAPSHVRLLPAVPPDDLVGALTEFDVGVVIDRLETENTRLALPNKLFEYLMAGLAVVVPNGPAMARLVEREGVGRTYEPGRLADVLKELAADRPAVEEMRRRARAAAVERYNAEAQRPALYRAWGL